MSDEPRFAAQAGRLAGKVALLLGWRPDEFWTATPAELGAIFSARAESDPHAGMSRDDLKRMMEHDGDG